MGGLLLDGFKRLGGARDKKSRTSLDFSCISLMESFTFEQQVLFRVDISSVTTDCKVPRTLNLRDLTVLATA